MISPHHFESAHCGSPTAPTTPPTEVFTPLAEEPEIFTPLSPLPAAQPLPPSAPTSWSLCIPSMIYVSQIADDGVTSPQEILKLGVEELTFSMVYHPTSGEECPVEITPLCIERNGDNISAPCVLTARIAEGADVTPEQYAKVFQRLTGIINAAIQEIGCCVELMLPIIKTTVKNSDDILP